jgi:hypothetical protein
MGLSMRTGGEDDWELLALPEHFGTRDFSWGEPRSGLQRRELLDQAEAPCVVEFCAEESALVPSLTRLRSPGSRSAPGRNIIPLHTLEFALRGSEAGPCENCSMQTLRF